MDSEATPRRVIDSNTRHLHAVSPSPSTSPSPSPLRLWRPAAQRNMRNQWSKLLASKDSWFSAASGCRSHATSFVNAFLSQRFMLQRDLGVLKDMPAIRDKACQKLAYQQELSRSALLSSYKDMVLSVSQMVKASKSMRVFLKSSTGSPIVQFCDQPEVMNDYGDGGGVPVFSSFSISDFEELAQELVAVFVLELALKRLLVAEFTSMQSEKEIEENDTTRYVRELFEGELDELRLIGLLSGESYDMLPPHIKDLIGLSSQSLLLSHEVTESVLQVYLTSWLANVNLNSSRIDEVILVVEETMQLKL
ncbi:Cyclin-dependent kinase 2-interacting protein [Rhynchospora pubera]|uniref:Cyclin-dependent kinase 2-interacting protein n=1 Tax=Rhynchospora pubera TaxID=906938 RepID=A0AAV8C5B9_9POAL|nr:Cyclin-dependent kinase 2-interacting protein [Rhynchospora pubera]